MVTLNRKALSKLEAALLIALLAVLSLTGYLLVAPKPAPAPAPPAPETITIVDSAGRYVTVPWPLKRVVALTTDAAEVIVALGAEDIVVGVTEYVTKKSELSRLANRTTVGTCFKPNIEAIVQAGPEAVITYVRWPEPEALEERLEPLGIKAIRLDFYKIDTLFAEVRLLGLLLNRTEEANEFVRFWEVPLSTIKERVEAVKPEEKPRIYIEGYHDYSAAGPGSGWDQDLKVAGGINIFADSPVPYPKVSPEAVVERNPSVIIKAVSTARFESYGATDPQPLKEILGEIVARPGWSEIEAVKNGRVYVISGTLSSGPRVVVGICYIAKWLYPELFEDLDPVALHRQYLERFLGVKYAGIWAYP